MSRADLEVEPDPRKGLRVAIVMRDPKRRSELARLVVAAGHTVATDDGEIAGAGADVVLADRAIPSPHTPLVTLGVDDVEQAGSLPSGASGAQIDAALRAAAVGLVVRPAETGGGFGAGERASAAFGSGEGASAALITPRELEILTSIAAGLSNKAIARRLEISQHTVKFHIESLFRKLDARTRAEAVAKGLERRRIETIDV
jgi:DNA-binding CsgD family transcriptional regulator